MGILDGKVALITGAGRGFGLAIAERFAEEGADVALNYRASREACDALAGRTRAAGQRALAVEADITDGAAVAVMVARVIDAFGRIDILVNNAGIMHLAPFVASSEEAWREELEVNLFGTLRVTHAVLPGMIAQRSGKIINLSSQLALIGWDRAAVYAGSKGFILTWSKSLAREVGKDGINVNVIGPGSIITDMNKDVYPSPEAAERRAAELPLRRLGSPRDVAECALFLASDAAAFLTGQMLGPNGGNVM
jgi:NAD(P)-dependent dehydrogenase (short-subunit alcohol dehydrogenase family)